MAGAMVVDSPLLRRLRDHLACELPILHMAIWNDTHQVSTGPCEDLGPPNVIVELKTERGEVQFWLTQKRGHRRTKRIANAQLPWIEAALRSSKSYKITQFEANTDPLTGLGNRRALYAERRKFDESKSSYGVLLLDLNDFKSINDTWDHQLGDQALVRFTEILRNCTRHTDTLVRLGGDEFLVIAKDASPEGMILLGERIALASHSHRLQLPNGVKYRISASIGWACSPEDGRDWEGLIALADQRMYVHKENQKTSVA